MKRLIYLSSSAGLPTAESLEGILNAARRNNRANRITGLLMYHDGAFLQILEGEQKDVDTTFARIVRDSRHRGVLKLMEADIAERLFPDWTMGFARPEDMPAEARDKGLMAFKAVREDLERIAAQDKRASAILRSYFASFRDIGPDPEG